MDLKDLIVEFSGGTICGRGRLTVHEGTPLSVDDEGTIRTGHAVVEVEFLEPAIVSYDSGGVAELPPGAYMISSLYGILPKAEVPL